MKQFINLALLTIGVCGFKWTPYRANIMEQVAFNHVVYDIPVIPGTSDPTYTGNRGEAP